MSMAEFCIDNGIDPGDINSWLQSRAHDEEPNSQQSKEKSPTDRSIFRDTVARLAESVSKDRAMAREKGTIRRAEKRKNQESKQHDNNNNIDLKTDEVDLTEKRMRGMRSEELNAELTRRGVDPKGLRKIWTEKLPPSVTVASQSVVATTSAVCATTTAMNPPQSSTSGNSSSMANIIQLSPNKAYVLRFDGGSRGNPGICGAGMVIYENNNFSTELWGGSLFLTRNGTNNEAEYQALISGLKCAQHFGAKHIMAQGDSDLVVKQIMGIFKCKSPNLIPLLEEAMSVRKSFTTFKINHIPRLQNHRADELANEAMSSMRSRGMEALTDGKQIK